MALGRPAWKEARSTLQKLLSGTLLKLFLLKLLVHNVMSSLILNLLSGMWHGCAADEPTLRDNDGLRSKAIIPMVLCHAFCLKEEMASMARY